MSPRRSQSLVLKAGGNVLVPEVGTASDQVALASGYGGEAAADDLYMEGISIRRGFASEFIELLEVGGWGTVVRWCFLLFWLGLAVSSVTAVQF